MPSKTLSTPVGSRPPAVSSPAPEVIPDTITDPVSNGRPAARTRRRSSISLAHPRAAPSWCQVMTRSTPLAQAVDAKRKAMAAAHALAKPASMKFLLFEDNRGGYQWTIVGPSGQTLVESVSFASSEEAKQAAHLVHAGAGSASLEQLDGETSPVDLVGRANTWAVRADLDAERWLDEGGSASSEKVTRWPEGR